MNMEKTFSERLKTYFFSLFWGNDYAKEIRTSSLPELAEKKYEENAKNSLGISGRYLKKSQQLIQKQRYPMHCRLGSCTDILLSWRITEEFLWVPLRHF